jgi:hypothetical protein
MGLALRARLGVSRDLLLVDAEQSVELFFRCRPIISVSTRGLSR